MDWSNTAHWLLLAFLGAMGLAILIYAVMDGYDLGVGLLMLRADETDRGMMTASIGPFWDANETWLVLSVGLLLVAFPKAHGIVLSGLYLPVTIMLMGLILRGVAFDFRAKAQTAYKKSWVPFASVSGVFILAFAGLAYSFFPYVIPDQLTVWEAASNADSLSVIFIGTVIVLPAILAYTAFSYYVFRGKATSLVYH